MKKPTKEQLHYGFTIIYGLLACLVLVFSLLTIHVTSYPEGENAKLFLSLAFFSLCLARTAMGFYVRYIDKKWGIASIKNLAFALVYLITAILILCLYAKELYFYHLVGGLYLGTIAANRICLMIEKRKLSSYIFNGALATLSFFVIFAFAFGGAEVLGNTYLLLILLVVIVVSFVEVLAFAFSRIQLRGLLRIIRTTFVFEILYGLIILIITFSFFFMLLEEEIVTYGDGLWVSFAIVTTIGFGDLNICTPEGRILAAILGIYGLIVVASITSVVVNYYNEVTKNRKKAEEESQATLEEEAEEEHSEEPKEEE